MFRQNHLPQNGLNWLNSRVQSGLEGEGENWNMDSPPGPQTKEIIMRTTTKDGNSMQKGDNLQTGTS